MQIVATGFGSPDVLKAVPSEVRYPGKGEVSIAVRAAAVNHRDYKVYASRDYTKSSGADAPTFPLELGVEASGVVTEVGEEAIGDAGPIVAGDEVIAYRIDGAYADAITVSVAQLVPKPRQLNWEQAASIMLTGTTAVHALAAIRARSGQTILIHAAAGDVGFSAVQLAALDGINVVGTASEKDFDLLRQYGATPVKYGEGLLDRIRDAVPQGIDAALDFIGTEEAVDVSLHLVQDRSRIATIVAFDRAKRDQFLAIGGSAGQDSAGVAIRNAARLRLTALAQAGAFDVRVAKTFPLAEAADAHRLLAKGAGAGHIVLLP
jgi:NADPH2:quinone reductase